MVEVTALVIAVFGFGLSLVTAYYQFLHKATRLRFTYHDMDITESADDAHDVTVKYSVTNDGNRPVLVSNMALLVTFLDGNVGQRGWRDIDGESHDPMSINPGDIVADNARFRISDRTIAKASSENSPIHVHLVVVVVDFSGDRVERLALHFNLQPRGKSLGAALPPPKTVQLLPVPRGEQHDGMLEVP